MNKILLALLEARSWAKKKVRQKRWREKRERTLLILMEMRPNKRKLERAKKKRLSNRDTLDYWQTTQKPAAEVVEQPVSKPLSTESQAFSVDKALVEKAIVEGDAEAFLSIMKQMAEHIETVSEAKRSSILTSVPEMATSMAMQKIEQMNAVNAFYAENPDLVDHRATVGMIANRIVSQNPQFSLKEVFEATEKETRKHLGIKKKLAAGSATEGRNFVKSAGARKPGKKQLTGMKAEIAAMNAARR